MALDKPLRELGLNSERLLMPTKASKFEDEVADLEQKVGLTTLAKAVAWARRWLYDSLRLGSFAAAASALFAISAVIFSGSSASSVRSVSLSSTICTKPPAMNRRRLPPAASSTRRSPAPSLASSGARCARMPISPS